MNDLKLCVGAHIEVYPYENTKLNIYNRNTGKTYILGEKETRVFRNLNGVNTLEEIQDICPFYTKSEIDLLIDSFSNLGFFEKKENKMNLLKLKFCLWNPNKWGECDSKIIAVMYYIIMMMAPILAVSGFIIYQWNSNNGYLDISEMMRRLSEFTILDGLAMVLLCITSLLFHELAHVIVARKYGVNVPEVGVMLYYLIPCAYTNISGINLLQSKWKRILILLSGSLVNLGIIGGCYIVMARNQNIDIQIYCVIIILVNACTIFMNTMIFIKFDGYYILEIILEESRLRENAIEYLNKYLQIQVKKNKEMKYKEMKYKEMKYKEMKYKEMKYKEMKKEQISAMIENNTILPHTVYCTYAILSIAYIPFILLNSLLVFLF